jgi:NAD+ synthetase
MIDYSKFLQSIREWLSDYIEDNHLQSLIIGISGGIDSTVVCAIVSPVCQKMGIPLIGRSLPAYSNSSEEINTATLVGQAFCDDFKEAPIERMFGIIADELELNEGKMTPLQLGNIKARLRMIYLYNLASIHRGCVLDTDNRTEHELGFWTIHGDVGDLNCGLIHLWKTEVYELADYLLEKQNQSDKYQALLASIELTPTDGNGVKAGGDCAQFGLDNYEQVDDVLRTMYFPDGGMDNITHKNEYIRLIDSYNEQGVDKVMVLHQNSKFKRNHLPVYPYLCDLV